MIKKDTKKDQKLIAISGGFDPVHIGHIQMLEAASNYGKVVVIVNSDSWLAKKKGYVFMPFDERCAIMGAFAGVFNVIGVDDSDGSVCEALEKIKPDFFGNGGDRTNKNIPELDLCNKLGIDTVFSLGGSKVQSSSKLVSASESKEAKDRWIQMKQWFDTKYQIDEE
tara:strand:- start:156 stop:656 length:501 start_codon:yes stop_codon:yes gene_type:complete